MDAYEETVASILLQYRPKKILVVGDIKPQALSLYEKGCPELELAHASLYEDVYPHAELVVMSGVLESLPREQARQKLALMRDVVARRIILRVDTTQTDGWSLADFLGLAMRRLFAEDNIELFAYAIDDYKKTPDWLNSRFWAHPERFKL